nr:hypothetical protein [Tanacetum cinerariifolium]
MMLRAKSLIILRRQRKPSQRSRRYFMTGHNEGTDSTNNGSSSILSARRKFGNSRQIPTKILTTVVDDILEKPANSYGASISKEDTPVAARTGCAARTD